MKRHYILFAMLLSIMLVISACSGTDNKQGSNNVEEKQNSKTPETIYEEAKNNGSFHVEYKG